MPGTHGDHENISRWRKSTPVPMSKFFVLSSGKDDNIPSMRPANILGEVQPRPPPSTSTDSAIEARSFQIQSESSLSCIRYVPTTVWWNFGMIDAPSPCVRRCCKALSLAAGRDRFGIQQVFLPIFKQRPSAQSHLQPPLIQTPLFHNPSSLPLLRLQPRKPRTNPPKPFQTCRYVVVCCHDTKFAEPRDLSSQPSISFDVQDPGFKI